MRRDRIGIRQDKRTVRRECRWIVADRRTCTVSRGELVPAGRVCLYGFKGSELLRFGSHDRPRQQAEHGRATTDQACTVTGDTTHSGTIHSSLAESPPPALHLLQLEATAHARAVSHVFHGAERSSVLCACCVAIVHDAAHGKVAVPHEVDRGR